MTWAENKGGGGERGGGARRGMQNSSRSNMAVGPLSLYCINNVSGFLLPLFRGLRKTDRPSTRP